MDKTSVPYIVDPRLGTFCDADELALSDTKGPDVRIHCLTRGQAIGVSLSAESGFISFIALLVLAFLVVRNRLRGRRIVKAPLDVHMLHLFLAELFQSVGIMMDTHWVVKGKVEAGMFCNAQGAIRQIGEAGVAMILLIIAIHTFIVVWFRPRLSNNLRGAWIAMLVVWLYLVLFVAISISIHSGDERPFESPAPFWCWIGSSYTAERILGQYLWFWTTVLVSLVLYLLLFLLARGNVNTDPERWWRFSFQRRTHCVSQGKDGSETVNRAAYPVVYSLTVLPLSIARWTTFVNGPVPSAATFSTVVILGLSGLFNVLLLLYARPNLLGFNTLDSYASRARRSDEEASHVTGGAPSVVESDATSIEARVYEEDHLASCDASFRAANRSSADPEP
ncbi:hypothetical protein PUNSTDRAFT_145817 [Punctularia strigosozonata HHB-11173 SS5]|uniref:uncharacterized protein n=1 Tax=Punctularia strigosozonata (strain HHB-11173) TaxID=741275 RepID=UPI0004417721|nr:uncharacterized protein PUNSTDRAFT_145817 [Punctularia strigosozonata HHB-11173 SS5]EIN05337.1 hypothetical protein PUNSTDRAFT_145817 [Punctularia strigosozonata HHB-11173 SS5]